MRKLKLLIISFVAFTLLSGIAAFAAALPTPVSYSLGNETPGQPVIINNSVYTAWGTPIRGAQADIDIGWPSDEYYYNKTTQLLNAVPEHGMNAVHLYMESLSHYGEAYQLGAFAKYCDFIVEEAGKRGLYVIIKMGGMDDRYNEETIIATAATAFSTFTMPGMPNVQSRIVQSGQRMSKR
jgi:hypothetical protein